MGTGDFRLVKVNLAYFFDLLPVRSFRGLISSKKDVVFEFYTNVDFLKALFFFKNHTFSCFANFVDLVAVHFPGILKFHLYYILSSLVLQEKIFLKFLTEGSIFSIVTFFKGANWVERECWDMFGLFFLNHLDLRRILTDYGFSGYPLKKDFPLTGYLELRYDEPSKSLIYENVELSQELREFKFSNPWIFRK